MLHIANADFEWELIGLNVSKEPIFQKLRLLPFLYADPQDRVILDQPPPSLFFNELRGYGIAPLDIASLSEAKKKSVASWGASLRITQLAKDHDLDYFCPPWEVVRAVNSKRFSFERAPKLPGAALIENAEEARAWIKKQVAPSVFKTCFGVSGRGHWHVKSFEPPPSIQKEFDAGRVVIAEPWVLRQCDFSTQWKIDNEIHYLGVTLCCNDAYGRYKSTQVGNLDLGHFLIEHKAVALPILEEMKGMGYFGNVGIDAFIYNDQLHPIVEINARKTMGWVALRVQQRYFPEKKISFSFLPGPKNWLTINVLSYGTSQD